jgi:hypothetical protein
VFIAYLSILHKQQSEEGEQWNTLQQWYQPFNVYDIKWTASP